MIFPDVTRLLPSSKVAIAPPPVVDIVSPFITSALSAVKAGVSEYRDAKNAESQLDTLSTYYRSKGMADVANLLESQKEKVAPNFGAAILGIDTKSSRDSVFKGVSALASKELDFKRESELRSETLRNQILLADRGYQNQYRVNVLDFNQSVTRDAAKEQVATLDNDIREVSQQIDNLAKMGSSNGNVEAIRQLEAKKTDIERRRNEAIAAMRGLAQPLPLAPSSSLPALPSADPNDISPPSGDLLGVTNTQTNPQSSPQVTGPDIIPTRPLEPGETPMRVNIAPGSPAIDSTGITLVSPPNITVPTETGSRTGSIYADQLIKNSDERASVASSVTESKLKGIEDALLTAKENGKLSEETVSKRMDSLAQARSLLASGDPVKIKMADSIYSDLDTNITRDIQVAKEPSDQNRNGLVTIPIQGLNPSIQVSVRGNNIVIKSNGSNESDSIAIPINQETVDLKQAILNHLVKVTDPKIRAQLEAEIPNLPDNLRKLKSADLLEMANKQRQQVTSPAAQTGSSLPPATNNALRNALSSKPVGSL